MEINESIGYLLNTSAKKIKNHLNKQLRKFNITSSQWAIIKLLSEKGMLTQAEIASDLQSDRATCGTVIDKLIEKNLVLKKVNVLDRRSFNVLLSPKGEKIVTDITIVANTTNKQALLSFDSEQVKQLESYLKTIIINLEEVD